MHGNELQIDPHSIGWRRCVDINDRALRDIALGLAGDERLPGQERLRHHGRFGGDGDRRRGARPHDLRERLGSITVAYTLAGEPVIAERLRAAGAMAVLLKDAIMPNLVQRSRAAGARPLRPVRQYRPRQHSLIADLIALKLADYVITSRASARTWGCRSS